MMSLDDDDEYDDPWLFTSEELTLTPSRLSGISPDEEQRRIKQAALLIFHVADKLCGSPFSLGASIKLLQRFYMLESITSYDPLDLAGSCLFLGSKTQEAPLRIQDVIYWTFKLRTKSEDFPEGEEVNAGDPRFFDAKQLLLRNEREILRVMNFDLMVEQPYKIGYDLVNRLHGKGTQTARQLVQLMWPIMNDTLIATNLHLRFKEGEIVYAIYFLAAKSFPNYKISTGDKFDNHGNRIPAWFEGKDVDHLQEILEEILDVYEAEINKTT